MSGTTKLPAFQFYPADWRKDPGVQALNFHDRGVWFEILCLLHESQDRGKLLLNGMKMPDDALARLLGLDKQVLTNTLTTLLAYGVASRDPATEALMSRRMVRDENVRKIRKECGKLGGNPNLVNQKPILLNQTSNQKPTTQVNQKSTPSSSSSISSSEEIPPNPQGGDLFGEILPSGWKKLSKAEMGRKRVIRNSPLMARVGKFLSQRESTLWTIAEYVALQDVNPSEDDLELIEQHYSLVLENNGYRFKDLLTLLNNWPKARTRADAYFQENPDHRNA